MKSPSSPSKKGTPVSQGPIARLFDEHSGAVYGYLLRLSGDSACADELTSETFLRAMLALDGFRGDSSVKTWLLTIARNLYLNRVKREKRMTSLEEMVEKGAAFAAAPHTGPEAAALANERSSEIEQALLALNENDRSILLLASQEKLNYQEIGQVLNISVSAVKVRVFRARRRLAKLLK
jgi:RNA polymerase sigma-70 factor (ECF subfamily)